MEITMNPLDLAGKTFGRWTVLGFAERRNRATYWHCRCECGKRRKVKGVTLTNGTSTSCGCSRRKPISHGMSKTPTWYSWLAMRRRCYEPSHSGYSQYGGRGIKVCDRWRDSFENFLTDMGYRPDGMTLDRIDNDGDYTPTNCRWADANTQARNRKYVKTVTCNGESLTKAEWARRTGVTQALISMRINKLGWDVCKACTTPRRSKR
jgi:hypothetical protein